VGLDLLEGKYIKLDNAQGFAYLVLATDAAISWPPLRSRSSRWKAMRCADLGPTPGRQRNASISRLSEGG
jgi:hypothetical protein